MNKMIRLTKKLHKGLNDKIYVNNADNEDDVYQKLGKLEDVEDELGCPLEVLVKALKQECIYCEKAYNFDNDEEFDELNHIMDCEFKLRFFTLSEDINKNSILNIQENLKDYDDKWCFEFKFDIDGDNFYTWEWDYYLVKLADYKKKWWLREDKSE